MDIILATRNQSKTKQIKAMLRGLDISLQSLDEAGISGEAVESGKTLWENASKKAMYAWEKTHGWCLADDTGVFIDILDGAPGIHAARWAGEEASTEDIMNFTLAKLTGVPNRKRTGRFVTVAVAISPLGNEYHFEGIARGRFLHEPRVPCQPNMPYSGIFVPDGSTKVWAEMAVDEENAISHRGKAFKKVRDFLQQMVW